MVVAEPLSVRVYVAVVVGVSDSYFVNVLDGESVLVEVGSEVIVRVELSSPVSDRLCVPRVTVCESDIVLVPVSEAVSDGVPVSSADCERLCVSSSESDRD